MKLPISWLKDYVDFEDTVEGLADKLTFSGVEVEGIDTVGSDYAGMVVGEVRSVEKHPNADRLTLCTVFDGSEERQVVCGAPNVQAGMKGAFAPVGAKLADGTKLKKAKIRGVESRGMLCAEDELGLSDDHTGIMNLAGDWEAGTPLSEVLGPPETVLDLEITPNRPDCLSIIGLAREVAALYGTSLKVPAVEFAEIDPPADQRTRVDVEDPEGCPRYTARIVADVEGGPSPAWMQKRLTLAGIRPINSLVDITNYVLIECGHPLHAFDQALLEEGRVVVRRARKGERISTLDDIERELDEDMLIIADATRPVAVAGVMGGAGSEIRDDTRTVLLESAYFDPPMIRATSSRLGLRTESSYRFERGTDILGVDWASRRTTALMVELAGGKAARGMVDVFPSPPEAPRVCCRWARVRSLVGVDAPNEAIRETFSALGLEVVDENETDCTIAVPSFRLDLEREADLVEEFARIYGLDKIPAPAPRARIIPGAEDLHTRALTACRSNLVGLGLREIMNYTLVSDALLNLFDKGDEGRRVRLPHPISRDQSVLRTSLIPQVVETLGRNHSRQCRQMACFEIGRVFARSDEGPPFEEERLAIGLMGPVGQTGFAEHQAAAEEDLFLWLRGIWEHLAHAHRVSNGSVAPDIRPFLREGRTVRLESAGKPLGVMGLVRPDVAQAWRLSGPIAVLEVELNLLLEHYLDGAQLEPIAPYPSVARDVAIVVEQSVKHEDVLAIVEKVAPKDLEKVELFDIFTGAGVGEGLKSMAYSFTYRSLTRTLTDEEANRYHETVKDAIRAGLKAEIRE